MTWAIFTSLASLASLIGLACQFYQNKEKPLTYALLVISVFCAIVSAVLWSKIKVLEIENEKLKSVQFQADQLVKSWPAKKDFDFVSSGEFRGIVLSGMAFFEKNKDVFPDTYSTTQKLMFSELEVASDTEKNFIAKRVKLQEAAEVMLITINTIRLSQN